MTPRSSRAIAPRCFAPWDSLTPEVYPLLSHEAEQYFMDAVPAGGYVAWLAVPADEPDTVVAGAGVQLRLIVPRPNHTGTRLLTGEQGLVLNVLPKSRGAGVASPRR